MWDYRLNDAFWHPALGVVLVYEYDWDDGRDVQTRMDYLLPHPTCTEDEAPEFVAFWRSESE